MGLALKRPIIYFDVETTGLDPQKDRIIELAAVKHWPDGREEEKCRRFNPLIPIPKEATAIHGITDADVKNELPFARYARGPGGIGDFFKGCDLAGFNIIYFDIPMLKAELVRAGENLDISDIYVVDAYRIFTTKEPRDLGAAVRYYCGESHTDAHSALGDVQATVAVLNAQLDKYADLPRSPAELDTSLRHPESVDREGKLKWMDGEISISFGRHKGRTLKYLAREEPDYLRWMIDNEIAPDAAAHLRDALMGHFAAPPEKK
ncbi:MAG: exonuclease domain-containing protein [Myxococcota bacterium]|nr:exonuclease domain-containing protein [Myxococcota bacterium]